MCYKKRDKYDNHKRSFGSPKAHQFKIGSVHTQDPLFSQSEDNSSEEDSFCSQIQVQSTQAKTNYIAPQHLVTNLEYKLKPHKKRTKFLRGRIDTCANVNLMPISVNKLLCKDHDCQKLATSNKNKGETYCTEKIQIVGSCSLFVLHLDTKCLQEVTFQVTSHEGSVIISCATSLELCFIQLHRGLDVVPEKGSLIYSKADLPVKQKNKKSAPVNKLSDSLNSGKMQSHTVSRVQETEVIQCMNKKVETKGKQQQCQAPIPTVFNDKNCQAETNVTMQPKKPQVDVWSKGSAMLIQHNILKKQEDDKNCQSIKNVKSNELDSQFTLMHCSAKNCQENDFMWSVKIQMDVQLKKPAMKSSNKTFVSANDKNCQATIRYKKQKNVNMMTLEVNLQ